MDDTTYILGLNSRVKQESHLTGLGGDPAVKPPFKGYFSNTFSMDIEASKLVGQSLFNRPNERNLNMLSLTSKGKTFSISFFGEQFSKSINFRKAEQFPKFDESIAEFFKLALKYQEHRPTDWEHLHDINRVSELYNPQMQEYGKSEGEMGRPFYNHIDDSPEKKRNALDMVHEDIHNHIVEHGFGPEGWLPQRSQEFLNRFKKNNSIRVGQHGYLSAVFQSALRGIPQRHMLDFCLDYYEKMDPQGYRRLMNLNFPNETHRQSEYTRLLLLNTHFGGRRNNLVKGYVQNTHCTS